MLFKRMHCSSFTEVTKLKHSPPLIGVNGESHIDFNEYTIMHFI